MPQWKSSTDKNSFYIEPAMLNHSRIIHSHSDYELSIWRQPYRKLGQVDLHGLNWAISKLTSTQWQPLLAIAVSDLIYTQYAKMVNTSDIQGVIKFYLTHRLCLF